MAQHPRGVSFGIRRPQVTVPSDSGVRVSFSWIPGADCFLEPQDVICVHCLKDRMDLGDAGEQMHPNPSR